MILANSGGMNFICSNQKCVAPSIIDNSGYIISARSGSNLRNDHYEPPTAYPHWPEAFHLFALANEPTKTRQDHYDCLPILATNKRYSEKDSYFEVFFFITLITIENMSHFVFH